MKKYGLYLIGGAALVLLSGAFFIQRPITYEVPARVPVVREVQATTSTLIFVGDIMLSRAIGAHMAKNGDWSYPFMAVEDSLKQADLTFGNLEGPLSTRGERVGSIYSFEADPQSVEGLVNSGFDVLSIANNHIWDYDAPAFEDTLKTLADNGISPVGGGYSFEIAHTPVVKDVNGTRVAFLAYTDLLPSFLGKDVPGPSVASPDDVVKMSSDIRDAGSLADIVVVSFHWGEEYQTVHNAAQEKLAHAAIDAGADLIVGHHPHVVEDIEQYKGKYIAYSLGNFVFDQNFDADTRHGMLLTVTLRDKKIVSVTPQEVRFTETYQPYLVQ